MCRNTSKIIDYFKFISIFCLQQQADLGYLSSSVVWQSERDPLSQQWFPLSWQATKSHGVLLNPLSSPHLQLESSFLLHTTFVSPAVRAGTLSSSASKTVLLCTGSASSDVEHRGLIFERVHSDKSLPHSTVMRGSRGVETPLHSML